MGNSTFYKWRAKYGGMDASLLQRMKELESENKRLKKLYAESQLEADIIRDALRQNAYIERFNRTVRYDYLNQDIFTNIQEVQDKSTKWLWHYNHERPNMALGGITPYQKRMMLNQAENSTKSYS